MNHVKHVIPMSDSSVSIKPEDIPVSYTHLEGLSTQETSDMIRNVNHLEHGSLAAGAHLKVPARS